MNLWYLNIGLDRNIFPADYCYEFKLHTRFISNYLSLQIRKTKHRFVTDGSFQMISVDLSNNNSTNCEIVPIDVLRVNLDFDKKQYEKIKGTDDCEYYLRSYERAFKKAAEFKNIPLDTLLNFISEFRKNGYKNEWRHKKKQFKEIDIEIILDCYFTTKDFKLVASISRVSTKELLCSGVVLRTDPDEVCFDYKFRDISFNSKNIIIENRFKEPSILINIKDVLDKRLNPKLVRDS